MKHNKMLIIVMALFFSVISSVFANPFGLEDPTVYDPDTNVCTTETNNYKIVTYNCKNEDVDGKNINQLMDFTWLGTTELQADLLFVFDGVLAERSVFVYSNFNQTKEVEYYNTTEELITYNNISNLSITGNQAIFNFNNSEVTLDFNNYSNISNNYTFNVNNTVSYFVNETFEANDWISYNNQFSVKDSNTININRDLDYYSLDGVTFQPGETKKVKLVYTPDKINSVPQATGKYHIFAKPSAYTLDSAITSGNYIYQDPWWDSNWEYKRELTVNSPGAYTNGVFEVVLNSSNFDYSKSNGDDIRFLNSAEDTELQFKRFIYNESGNSIFYVQSDLTTGDNTFYLYYNNSLASDSSNTSIFIENQVANLDVYYEFDDGLTTDGTGNFTLTDSGTTNATGNVGQSRYFDGTDHATIPASATNSLSAGTVAFWVKLNDETVSYNLFGKSGASFRSQWVTGADDLYFQVNGEASLYTTANLNWSTWNHVVFTWDGTNKKIYVNGVENASASTTNSAPATGDLYLGHNSANTNERLAGNLDEFLIYSKTLNATEISDLYNSGSYNRPKVAHTITVGSEQTNLAISNTQLSELSYLDLNTDGTNYGKTSDGFTAGETNLYNITPVDDTTDQTFILSRTELDGAITISINGNVINTSPAYASGTGDWIFEVYNVSASYLNAGVNEVNITADSGNGETIYVDYIALGDRQNITNGVLANGSWVVTYATITTTNTIDTVRKIVTNSTGSVINNSNEVANDNIGVWNYLYIQQLPNTDQNYSFGIQANTTADPTFTNSSNDPEVEIDGTTPVLNSITLNLNSYLGEDETYSVNLTEKNVDYVTVDVNGTYYNLSLLSSVSDTHIYNLTFNYSNINQNLVNFYVYDLVGKVANYSVNVDVSEITQTNSAWDFNTLFNLTNFIEVADTSAYYDQYFKVPVTLSANGTASINDYNGTYTILDTNPTNITVTLENSTIRSFANNTLNLSWLTDTFTGIQDNTNNIRYTINNALLVEWENSGVSDTRLFYANSYNLTNVPKNVTLKIPLRTTYNNTGSSLDIFECTGAINWGSKTCGQWTEITTEVYTQADLTYHHWGSEPSDFPTVDGDSDGKKDTLYFTLPNVSSEKMFKIELDSANGEVSWSASEEPSTPASSGGGGGGFSNLLPSTTTDVNETITQNTEEKNNFIGGFWEFVDVVFTWISDNVKSIFSSLAPLFNGDPKNTILIVLIAIMLVGIPLVSGGSAPKKRGVASRG